MRFLGWLNKLRKPRKTISVPPKRKLACTDCGRFIHKRDKYRIVVAKHIDCMDLRQVGQRSLLEEIKRHELSRDDSRAASGEDRKGRVLQVRDAEGTLPLRSLTVSSQESDLPEVPAADEQTVSIDEPAGGGEVHPK